MEVQRKRILYIEDDPESILDLARILSEKHELQIGAHWELIRERRDQPFDLLILDIMIHPQSYDLDGRIVTNIRFPGVSWTRIGLEFLRRLRQDAYVHFGIPSDIPVIVASAIVDYEVQREIINELGVDPDVYLEKPFTKDTLEKAVQTALGSHLKTTKE